MAPTEVLAAVTLLLLVAVESGGWALLRLITNGEDIGEFRERFFRAGHAHAGVLLALSLAYFLYLPRSGYGNAGQWAAGSLLLAGVLAQSLGFFVHLGIGRPGSVSAGTRLTRIGALLIGAALIAMAVGLIRTA